VRGTQPAKRSALFVWHGSEERVGSRYFVSHPTVELSSIAAVLNGDMIGRNAPDSAALLGATEPHLNSSDLVAITLAANKSIANCRYFLGCCRSSRELVRPKRSPSLCSS
jgi:Zn-dependent M28 family amino/carboxypeptidase